MVTATAVRMGAAGLLFALFVAGCNRNDGAPIAGADPSPTISTASGLGTTAAISNPDRDDRTRLEGQLVGTKTNPAASGRARWEQRPDRTKFNTQVEDLNTSGAHDVKVNGVSVTSINVSSGRGEVELDSRRGDIIPAMQIDDVVEVFDSNGNLVESGQLRAR
jgi:hypothetical protein